MKAVIVAAGQGVRLGCIGRHHPKCMLRVSGEPLLHYQLEALREAGIDEVTIVTGHLAEKIPSSFPGLRIKTVYNQNYPLTGGGYSFLQGAAGINDDLIYLVADILYDPEMVRRLSREGGISLAVQLRTVTKDDMKVVLDQHQVLAVGKDIPVAKASGGFLGAAFIARSCLGGLREEMSRIFQDNKRWKYHFGNAVNDLIGGGAKVGWVNCTDLLWLEVDNVNDLMRARQEWKKRITMNE